MKFLPIAPALLLVAACAHAAIKPLAPTPAPAATASQPPAALSNVVFLGDSLTAGMQNNSLSQATQIHGWPYLLAQQAGFAIVEPLVAAPGIPNELQPLSFTFPYTFATLPGQSAGRINTGQQATNLAVPGATSLSLLFDVPTSLAGSGQYGATNLVLGYPAGSNLSQVERAVAMQPSTVFLFTGAANLMPAILEANPSLSIPPSIFAQEFAGILNILKTQTSAHLIVANIPDVTLLPLLMPADQLSEEISAYTGQPASAVEQDLGLLSTDSVNEAGVLWIEQELFSRGRSTVLAPLEAGNVVTLAMRQQIQAQVQSYNQIVQADVAAAGGQLVDLHSMLNNLRGGRVIDGKLLTLQFLGGFFSADGLHPSNTGYAITANTFITAMNTALNLSVPQVNVDAIADQDPLFPSTGPISLQPGPPVAPVLGLTPRPVALPAAQQTTGIR